MSYLDDLDLLLEKYAAYLHHERRHTQNTIETYGKILSQYAEFVRGGGVGSLLSPRADELQSYLEQLRDRRDSARRLKPRTLAMHVDVLRIFYKWLAFDGRTSAASIRPILDMDKPKYEQALLPVLCQEQLKQLIDAANEGKNRYRNRAVVETMASTACRVSELVNMRLDNVNLNEGGVRCRVKGGRDRILFLGRFAVAAIVLYLTSERPRLATKHPGAPWLFLSPRHGDGGRLERQTISVMLRDCARRIGIAEKVTPHTIRRSAAVALLLSGLPLRAIMDYLGHKSVSSTQQYLRLDPSRLKEAHAAYHPHGANGHAPGDVRAEMREMAELVRLPIS